MSDMGDIYDVLKRERQESAARRRLAASAEFENVRQLACDSGITLRRHSDAHYQFEFGESLLNFYPGNFRIVWDHHHKLGPHLKRPIGLEWTLGNILTAIKLYHGK